MLARTNAAGALDVDRDGRVEIRYREGEDAKSYRAAAANLGPAVGQVGSARPKRHAPTRPVGPAWTDDEERDHIEVWTDGACAGNPGPMGIGVVILERGVRREVGEHIGMGTNNIAELGAIERALDVLSPRRERPILIHVDSSYAIGVLAGGFKAKANAELVAGIRAKLKEYPRLRFAKVDGHAGVTENERCDELARRAISRA